MSVKLILIRGLPGSGKSTLAKTYNAIHLEADMYFINERGEYLFEPLKLSQAHQWCLQRCQHYLKNNKDVVVANTFVKQWEMDSYKKLACKYNAALSIIVCSGQFESIHQVPESTLLRMKRGWQD